jgi:hypothetical protein
MEKIMRDLERFTSTPEVSSSTVRDEPQLQSMLLVGAGGNAGAGAKALACWAAVDASNCGEADYVRLVTSLDLLSADGGGGDEEARAATLVERFSDAGEMQDSLLVLDDVDQLCAGSGPGGYSSIMLATLKELLRSLPASSNTAKVGENSQTKQNKGGRKRGKTLRILAATSQSDAACVTLHELFDETLVLKPLRPCISSKLPYAYSSIPNTMAPCSSILKKKGTPKASSPSEQHGDDSLRKLKRVNSVSSEDGRSVFAKARLVIQNTEQEGSIRDDITPVLDIKKQVSMPGIKFADNIEVNEISRLQESAIDFCFYSEDALSNFRQEAFLESCGLDPSKFH